MLAGDLALRRLPVAAALDNAAHLTMGAAVSASPMPPRRAAAAQALTAGNLVPLIVFLVLLPCVVNGTFYIELALGRSLAWVDAALTARWKPSCTPARQAWHSRASGSRMRARDGPIPRDRRRNCGRRGRERNR